MKQATSDIIDIDGEEVSVNKVDAALQSVGVSLRDSKGEFRDLDDVLLELASKWDTIDIMSQRYVATMAAGSRQQSRFIAMMQDYDRTMELVDAAYNSAGSASQQFEKTQESLESKIARLENAWNDFLMGIADDSIIKGLVDALTGLLEAYNKITEKADGVAGSILRIGTVFAGLRVAKFGIDKIITYFVTLKSSVEGAASSVQKLSILQSLSQKINNFKMGRGFVVNADLNTTKAHAKLDALKADIATVWGSITSSPQPTGAILGFQELDGKMVATMVTAEGMAEGIKVNLSEVGTSAILTSEACEEIGEDLTKSGILGKAALDILQKELAETIALQEAANKFGKGGKSFTYNGKQYTNTKAFRGQLESKKVHLQRDIDNLGGATKTANKAEITTGTWKKGFTTLGSSLLPILKPLLIIAGVLGTIAAVAAVIYNTSPLKHTKNEVEAAAGAVEDYNRALENVREEADALSDILNEIDSQEDTFEELITGSSEFYSAIADTNDKLLEQIQLLEKLGYDIEYEYNENGLILVDTKELKEAQTKLLKDQIELQKKSLSAQRISELYETKSYLEEKEGKENSSEAVIDYQEQKDTWQSWWTDKSKSQQDWMREATENMTVGLNSYLYDRSPTGENKNKLDLETKKTMAAEWENSTYANDELTRKAGLVVLEHLDNAWDNTFGRVESNNYIVDLDGNPELKHKNGTDLDEGDLTDEFLKELGYSGWEEAARTLGLEYDDTREGTKGLYVTDADGNKKYVRINKHGQIDKQSQWEDYVEDPGWWEAIDSGFLAYKLAMAASGEKATQLLADSISDVETKKQVLYGTSDWNTSSSTADANSGSSASSDADDYKEAIRKATEAANERKRGYLESLQDTKIDNRSIFQDSQAETLAEDLQRLEVDTNTETALAYQTFVTAAATQVEEVNDNWLSGIKEKYYSIFQDLDLTDANESLAILNSKIEKGVEGAEELKEVLTSSGGQLDISSQFSDVLSSGALDSISEDIAKLSDEAGDIDVAATRELVDSSSELKAIMDEFNLSGYAMGKILTDIQSGELTLMDINNGLVESYKLLYSAMKQAEDVLYELNNADLGTDYTDIGKIYDERLETIQDLAKRKAFGSENFAKNIASLIGVDAWNQALEEANQNSRIAYEKVLEQYQLNLNDGNLYGSFSSLIKKAGKNNKIFSNDNGTISYDLSGFDNYDAVLDHMVDAFGVSREYAKAMLADMTTYSETLQNDLDRLNAVDNANLVYSQMAQDNDIAYTNLTDSELKQTFQYTKEWQHALEEAKEETKDWDTKTLQEQTEETAKKFKELNSISNSVTVNEKEHQIEETSSLGDKFYRDENGELKVERVTENSNNEGFPLEFDPESKEAIEQLSKNEQVIKMSTELDTEQFEAWLESYTGDKNAYQILLDAGFTQESIAAASELKNEIIAQLNGIAQALAASPIKIPISLDGLGTYFHFGTMTIPISLDGVAADITIGGEGTTTLPTESNNSANITTTNEKSNKFTAGDDGGSGKGYNGGSDSRDSGDSSGEDTEVEKRNYASENADKQLEALERVRETNDREAELIDKLPEEIQFPLKMANMAEDMAYEYQEIQINRNKLGALENERALADAEAIEEGILGEMGSGLPIYYDEMLGSYMWNVEAMNDLTDEELEKAHETKDALDELNSSIKEVEQELDGGKVQAVFHTAGKASKAFSKALKDTEGETDDLGEAFEEFGDKIGLGEQFKQLGQKIEDVIDSSETLDKEFEGLGIVSEETLSKLDGLPLGDDTKNLIRNTLGTNEGGTVGSWMGDLLGASGDTLTSIGDILNFDMMSMGLDMANSMKDMASQMIQYVVQFVQTIVNWWTNREDWLYNLLSAIEQEVRNFNRQGEVEERFRLYSNEGLDDLVSAWDAMRESLEKQIDLNEQLIESRQAELQFLNLTNLPFSPAFYYDYEEERVIENPWVYDIYTLLLDIGAMIPEIGGIFSSIKTLMEDNKQRMEDAVQEIEDARDEILELEKQQLELRTKYMEDEIELEELVMETIIEKQQEEIDNLSAMNDAITDGNDKLIETLNDKLDEIRQQRDNEEREEELGEKERRLAYLRQDTSNANRGEILTLQDELKDERRDYTDELIDQKISALEDQNKAAAEQRQKQIDLLQDQLDYTEKYGLQWEEAQTLIKNGFDSEGRLRVGTDLYNMLMSKEDFTSMGNGSTRQTQQLLEWNVTSIAAAAFREINDIWNEGFGNFAMSNDVHDQSKLHFTEDLEVEYRQLPSWLSFLQPAYNSIQKYLQRTSNNIDAFVETGYLSGKNSSSILGKTLIPLVQNIVEGISDKIGSSGSLSQAEAGYSEVVSGAITAARSETSTLNLGERAIRSITDGFAETGDSIVSGFKSVLASNSVSNQNLTENSEVVTINNNFNMSNEDGDFVDQIVDIFRTGNVGLKI